MGDGQEAIGDKGKNDEKDWINRKLGKGGKKNNER